MYEYVISNGEGTLIEFGITEDALHFLGLLFWVHTHKTMISIMVEPCDRYCETSK